MIKLIHVFDKIVDEHISMGSEYFTGKFGRKRIHDIILDKTSEIDFAKVVCPICGQQNVNWNHQYSRKQSYIWDNPEAPIEIPVPYFSYNCVACGAQGNETFTTDLTIDKTNLTYHYLFMLFHARLSISDMDILEFYNTLYGKLSEESFQFWYQRFRVDYIKLLFPSAISTEDLLRERVKVGDAFKHFYATERRFFMHSCKTSMVIFHENDGDLGFIRG